MSHASPQKRGADEFRHPPSESFHRASGSQSPPRTRVRRSRTGCLTCRARKVKCDEAPNECANCKKLCVTCKWPSKRDVPVNGIFEGQVPSAEAASSIAPVDSPKVDGERIPSHQIPACKECRRVKVGCSRIRPHCTRCSNLRIGCEYPEATSREVTTEHQHQHHSPSLLDDSLSSCQELETLIIAYFTYVYPLQANAFVHRGQFQRDVRNGIASPLLVKSICAVAARFLPGADPTSPDGGSLPAAWIDEVKNVLGSDADRFSTSKLAACLNLVQHEHCSGRYGSSWMYTSMAVRMALAIGFHRETSADTNLSWAQKEMRRRLMWAAFCADVMASGHVREFALVQASTVRLPLPQPESTFMLGVPHTIPPPRLLQVDPALDTDLNSRISPHPSSDCIHARFVRLMNYRREILCYVHAHDSFPFAPWDAGSRFDQLIERLDHWTRTLPPGLRFTPDNLYARAATTELGSLIAIHLWADELYCQLYHIVLPGFDESGSPSYLNKAPPGWLAATRAACYRRARAVRDNIRLIEAHFPDVVSTNPQMPIWVHNSVKVQLGYFSVTPLGTEGLEVWTEAMAGFEGMVESMGKMTQWFGSTSRLHLRDLLHVLHQHGFPVTTRWFEPRVGESGARTPPRGPVLDRLPYLRRYLQHPELAEGAEGEPSDGDKKPIGRHSSKRESSTKSPRDYLSPGTPTGTAALPRTSLSPAKHSHSAPKVRLAATPPDNATRFSFQPNLPPMSPSLAALLNLPPEQPHHASAMQQTHYAPQATNHLFNPSLPLNQQHVGMTAIDYLSYNPGLVSRPSPYVPDIGAPWDEFSMPFNMPGLEDLGTMWDVGIGMGTQEGVNGTNAKGANEWPF